MALDRRSLLKHAATLPVVSSLPRIARATNDGPVKADYKLRIEPVSLELAPGKTIKTTGYNGTVPGPSLRLREGRPGLREVAFRRPQLFDLALLNFRVHGMSGIYLPVRRGDN
jgi:hypothetical protein